MKKLFIIFLILLLVPVFLGKVQVGQFSDFFGHPSWDSFKSAFGKLMNDDYGYYKELAKTGISKLKDLIKGEINQAI
ncbi:MAG: hypothetical protein V1705_00750 [bacterium]